MAELSNSYIKGFVETCFKAGVHEKQAAALLDLAAVSMEKSAAGPSFWKGVGQLITGTGNVVGGAGKAVFGGGSTVLKPVGKGLGWLNDKAMVQPMKHYMDTKNHLAAFMHLLGVGALPPAVGLTAFQNWRDRSDSKLADAVNDVLGDPELLVFGNGGGSSSRDTSTYRPRYSSSGSSVRSVASPNNIPGTTDFTLTPGEQKLQGDSAGTTVGTSVLPRSVEDLVNRRRKLSQALATLQDTDSKSVSATVRARSGGNNAVNELNEQLADVDSQIDTLLGEHNRQVGINNANLAADRARLEKDLSDAKRRDLHQSTIGYNNPDAWWQNVANRALEFTGIRDTDAEAYQRAEDIRNLTDRLRDANATKPQDEIDVVKAKRDIANLK